ncbi:hypothetical protein ACIRNI_10425 [Streptomyces sp. NPDC093546]|uniref:SCO2195 family GlnR-regulated protein n=1 Tax=Streptomyces sp. NPDC093546 TaxID=3366040 RepID=UPI003805B49F
MAHEVREVRAHAFPPVPSIQSVTSVASVTGALRTLEALLLGAGQRTARRNAWTSVLEDRRRARDRVEAEHVLEAVSGRTSSAT